MRSFVSRGYPETARGTLCSVPLNLFTYIATGAATGFALRAVLRFAVLRAGFFAAFFIVLRTVFLAALRTGFFALVAFFAFFIFFIAMVVILILVWVGYCVGRESIALLSELFAAKWFAKSYSENKRVIFCAAPSRTKSELYELLRAFVFKARSRMQAYAKVSRARMRGAIGLQNFLRFDAGVGLSRRKRFVPEQILDGA